MLNAWLQNTWIHLHTELYDRPDDRGRKSRKINTIQKQNKNKNGVQVYFAISLQSFNFRCLFVLDRNLTYTNYADYEEGQREREIECKRDR